MSRPFTFGFELEFALAWHIPPRTLTLSTENKRDLVHDTLVRRLISHGVEAVRWDPLQGGYGKLQVNDDFSIHIDVRQLISDLWGVTSIAEPDVLKEEFEDQDGNRYAVAKIELSSSVYKLDDNWVQDLAAMVAAVTSGEFRSQTDHSCGLHVHVGQGEGYELPFGFMKKMSVVTTLLEEELDKMHPLYRRENNVFCASSLHSSPSIRRLSRAEVYGEIVKAENSEDLLTLLQECELGISKSFKVNYLGEHGTIEFRQHRGTLDVEEIEKWVRFVVGVTTNVERASWKEVKSALLSSEWKTRCLGLLGVDRIEQYSKEDRDTPFPRFG